MTPTSDPYGGSEELLVELDSGRLTITLNRPTSANALAPDQRDRLIDIFSAADLDPDVRVIVLTGSGRHFCAGADLSVDHPELHGDGFGQNRSGAVFKLIQSGAQRLVAGMLDVRKPVIAAVNGPAAGLGAQLALACDFLVMSDNASLIESFVNIGLAPDGGGAYMLPRLIGLARARQMILLGDPVSAEEARALGLALTVVSPTDLEGAVDELAARLARGPTLAIGLAKQMLNRAFELDRASAFAEEAAFQEIVTGSDDSAEGVQAFMEKRKPTFRGW